MQLCIIDIDRRGCRISTTPLLHPPIFKQQENKMFVIDPLNKYAHLSKENINELLGVIPFFVADREMDETVKETLTRSYGFGELIEMEGGEVNGSVYSYSGDSDLYPLAEMMSVDTRVLQFPYGIVSIIEPDGSTFTTRMS